jgi:hypothetical protein
MPDTASGLDKEHRDARISVSVAPSPWRQGQSSTVLLAIAKLAEDGQGDFELQLLLVKISECQIR